MRCVLLSQDLLFSSQVSQAAVEAGVALECVSDPIAAVARAVQADVGQFLLDLNVAGVEPSEIATTIAARRASPLTCVAIGPHVHRDKLAAARGAGWLVFTRGQFHAQAAQLLASWSQ